MKYKPKFILIILIITLFNCNQNLKENKNDSSLTKEQKTYNNYIKNP